ncbi:flagellar protein FliT [Piscirickettsia litoralis]|uniref:Flagellar protein FliT n=1 Tax=Piscirickettsia litoralis TaxID=1891921 RepID=A0ABX3A873_9GAMM|nr:flagellar protein FliT [Piscirickettsia litoralis]ODN43760.1 hypothetical protein BGC07_13710 [Piscirickettsia litoralis]
MSIKEDLEALREIMESMLLKAEEGEWDSLVTMDVNRSKYINKIASYSNIGTGNFKKEIELLIELDKKIIKICLNRKEDITKNLCNANKAMKGMNEYLKNT